MASARAERQSQFGSIVVVCSIVSGFMKLKLQSASRLQSTERAEKKGTEVRKQLLECRSAEYLNGVGVSHKTILKQIENEIASKNSRGVDSDTRTGDRLMIHDTNSDMDRMIEEIIAKKV